MYNKYMKKKIFILILIAILSFPIVACNNTYIERKLDISTSDIALLTLYSDDGKNESNFLARNYGHSFVAITNIGSEIITTGDMPVTTNETITIGLWSILEHFGIWYNVESNYIKETNKYNGRLSITIGLSQDDIAKINQIIGKNASWTPWYNCSKFALDIWNSVATESEKIYTKLFTSPGYLVKEIKNFSNYETNKICETSTQVRYYGEV